MDLKGISWVSDIYEKVESLCMEVEETMSQDTAKYVEDQMRNVGETFKKFYSDVMQDLLPPSSLVTVKEETSLSLNPLDVEAPHVSTIVQNADVAVHKIAKVKSEESVNAEAEEMLKNSDHVADSNDIVNYGHSCSAVCSVTMQCSEEEPCVNGNIESQCAGSDSSKQDPSTGIDLEHKQDSELKPPSVKKDSGEKFTFSETHDRSHESLFGLGNGDSESTSVLEVSNSGKDEVGVSQEVTEGNGSVGCPGAVEASNSRTAVPSSVGRSTFREAHDGSDESLFGLRDADSESLRVSNSEEDEVGISQEVTEGNGIVGGHGAIEANNNRTAVPFSGSMSRYFDEILNPVAASKIERGGADNRGAFVIEVDMANLGESCVLVEKNMSSLRFPLQDKQKSYKKIKDVFFPRRWSEGELHEEQHAVWYKEESGKNLVSTSSMHEGHEDPQLNDAFESDWELI